MVGSASPIASPIRWGRCRGWGSAPSRSWRPSNQTTDGRVDVQTVVQGSAAVVDYFAGRGGGATGGNRDKVAELGTSDHCDAKPAPRPGRLHHEQLPSNRSWRAFNILTSISCSGGHGAQPLGLGRPARRLPAGEYSPAQPPWQRSEGCGMCECCVAGTDSDLGVSRSCQQKHKGWATAVATTTAGAAECVRSHFGSRIIVTESPGVFARGVPPGHQCH